MARHRLVMTRNCAVGSHAWRTVTVFSNVLEPAPRFGAAAAASIAAASARRSAAICAAVGIAHLGALLQRQRHHVGQRLRAAPGAACARRARSRWRSGASARPSSRPGAAARPVSSWNSITPSEYRSLRPSTRAPGHLLGRHEATACPAPGRCGCGWSRSMRAMPKSVTFTRAAVRVDHDVGRLDVAVHHALAVRVGQRLGHARDDLAAPAAPAAAGRAAV